MLKILRPAATTVLLLLVVSASVAAEPEPFTIIVLPDTQKYHVTGNADTFGAQTQWIVDNIDARNIRFVTHEGDVVEDAKEDVESVEWHTSDEAMDRLDGRVPYSVSLGDHDYNRNAKPQTGHDHFVRWFGPDRYAGQLWYGGASPTGTSHYQLFAAGGRTYLHLNIECDAPVRDAGTDHEVDQLQWAQQVLNAHPGLPTIVTTHAYLTDQHRGGEHVGYMPKPEAGGPGRRNGSDIWSTLIAPNDQVFLVLCGNEHNGPVDQNGEYHRVVTNEAGNPVFEVLANYQKFSNGGNGWLRIVTFDEQVGEVRFETYSPTLDAQLNNEPDTPKASQFTLPLDFDARLGSN